MTEESKVQFSDVTVSGDQSQTPDTEAPRLNADDYEFVRTPEGIIAVPKSAIQESVPTVKQDVPEKTAEPEPDRHFYVHLADGDVLRVAEADLPDPEGVGSNQPLGHWRKGNAVLQVIGVYPAETIVK